MHTSDMLEAEGVSLVNRGLALWSQGLREEAVTVMRQGIAVCRQLAVAEPAKINHLALALSNLGGMLVDWGRPAEAIPVLEHSIKITRIYSDKSHEFTADLAGALKNLGSALKECGSQQEAIVVLTESVATYRRLVGQGRPQYEVPLARALNSLGNARGLVAEARDDFDAAIALLRREDLAESALQLAATLASQCGILMHLKCHERAVANSEEAVAIFRRLGDTNPAGVEPYLAHALPTMAEALVAVGRLDEAHTAATEAIGIVRRRSTANPDGWRQHLIRALRLLGDLLPTLNRHAEAAAVAEELARLVAEDHHDDKALHQPAPEKPKGFFLSRFKRRR
ncbi:tetratricopeptide repeat protein [Streptomyces sp. NPDC056296]|uniref:tetratricopeptide repeat protein n=1 Tax=Streptomyces sp. NPDC056296 TaxID=3345775 RepID=UPI0035E0F829